MKICVAQTRPVKADIQRNVERHSVAVDLAASCGADTIIFPELSLTGYEPTLAGQLATTRDDQRCDVFQELSDTRQIAIGAGRPDKQPRRRLHFDAHPSRACRDRPTQDNICIAALCAP